MPILANLALLSDCSVPLFFPYLLRSLVCRTETINHNYTLYYWYFYPSQWWPFYLPVDLLLMVITVFHYIFFLPPLLWRIISLLYTSLKVKTMLEFAFSQVQVNLCSSLICHWTVIFMLQLCLISTPSVLPCKLVKGGAQKYQVMISIRLVLLLKVMDNSKITERQNFWHKHLKISHSE